MELQTRRNACENIPPRSNHKNKRSAEDSNSMIMDSTSAAKTRKRQKIGLLDSIGSNEGAVGKRPRMIDVVADKDKHAAITKFLPELKIAKEQIGLPAVLVLRKGITMHLTNDQTSAEDQGGCEDFLASSESKGGSTATTLL